MSEPSIEEIERSSPFPLTDADRYNLSLTDAEFQPHKWDELKTIIGVLDLFTLVPAHLIGDGKLRMISVLSEDGPVTLGAT